MQDETTTGVAGQRAPGRPSPLRTRWRAFSRFAHGMLGADKYERYLQWHRTTQQPGEPMDRKQFWRHEYQRQEGDPSTRCC